MKIKGIEKPSRNPIKQTQKIGFWASKPKMSAKTIGDKIELKFSHITNKKKK